MYQSFRKITKFFGRDAKSNSGDECKYKETDRGKQYPILPRICRYVYYVHDTFGGEIVKDNEENVFKEQQPI